MRKKFIFDYTNKWFMHNPEFFRENEMHKIILDFDIQMDHLISACLEDFIFLADQRVKIERK